MTKHNARFCGHVFATDSELGSGIFDKNGQEIFEGDVVAFDYENCAGSRFCHCVILENGAFHAGANLITNKCSENIEIVGRVPIKHTFVKQPQQFIADFFHNVATGRSEGFCAIEDGNESEFCSFGSATTIFSFFARYIRQIAKSRQDFDEIVTDFADSVRCAGEDLTKSEEKFREDFYNIFKEKRENHTPKQMPETGDRVYIFEMENNTCKIGVSSNVKRRATEIHGYSGMKIKRWCCTVPLQKAFDIESTCHIHWAGFRRYGTEFFNVAFTSAHEFLQKLAEIECQSDGI